MEGKKKYPVAYVYVSSDNNIGVDIIDVTQLPALRFAVQYPNAPDTRAQQVRENVEAQFAKIRQDMSNPDKITIYVPLVDNNHYNEYETDAKAAFTPLALKFFGKNSIIQIQMGFSNEQHAHSHLNANEELPYMNAAMRQRNAAALQQVPAYGGGSRPRPRKTDARVKLPDGRTRCVFVHGRAKFVRLGGEFVRLADARRRLARRG